MSTKKKIVLIASHAPSLIPFRGDFMLELIKNNYNVYAAAPNFDEFENARKELTDMGITPIDFKLHRTGLNPFKDVQSLFSIKKMIKEHKIDIVFPYTIKPVVYGSLAASSLKLPVISLISGLGYTFTGVSLKAKLLQRVTSTLYRLALRKNKAVVFQNKDDKNLFLDKNILSPTQNYHVVDGSGVNLDRYPFKNHERTSDKIVFVFVARLIREKGIELYLNAAKKLKEKYPLAEFHILGTQLAKDAKSLDLNLFKECVNNKTVIHHGSQSRVDLFLANSDVFVLPTYYREGVPRSILEALSVGLPIITTDTPGCRETIVNGENGVLIDPQNLEQLIDAMEVFLKDENKIKEMGIKSRGLAKNKFDVNIINSYLIEVVNSNT